jgi:MFS family permease
MFLVMMMFAGVFWGFIEAFLFWFLDDLGAKKLEMGWTVTIGMLTSLPFLIFSGPITDTIGHINVIVLGMLAYFVRLLGYSFLENPLYVYPYEALEGFTMALMMTSAVTYVAKISTPSTIASVMGLMGSLFFGIGKGSGSLFGGLLMSYIGTRWTFRLLAATALACAVIYTGFQVHMVLLFLPFLLLLLLHFLLRILGGCGGAAPVEESAGGGPDS